MKKLLLAMMFITLVSYQESKYTCELTLTNGKKDTVEIFSDRTPLIYGSDVKLSSKGYVLFSDVKQLRIINQEYLK